MIFQTYRCQEQNGCIFYFSAWPLWPSKHTCFKMLCHMLSWTVIFSFPIAGWVKKALSVNNVYKKIAWSSTSLYFRRKGRYKTSVWSLIQQEVTCKMQTSSCRNLWLSLIHLLWERSEDGFTFQIECFLLSSSARSPLLIYVYDNILIISCYSLDRRSGRYDDAVVINPGNFIRQRWKA